MRSRSRSRRCSAGRAVPGPAVLKELRELLDGVPASVPLPKLPPLLFGCPMVFDSDVPPDVIVFRSPDGQVVDTFRWSDGI